MREDGWTDKMKPTVASPHPRNFVNAPKNIHQEQQTYRGGGDREAMLRSRKDLSKHLNPCTMRYTMCTNLQPVTMAVTFSVVYLFDEFAARVLRT